MGFETFAVYFVVAFVVAGGLHYGADYYIRAGWDSFVSKVLIGFVGAYYGMPYFGQWFEGVTFGGVYLLPTALGSFLLIVFAVDMVKTFKS